MATYINPSVKLPDKKNFINNKQHFRNVKEYREIKPAYFVFIDMLGFKATFNKSDTSTNIKDVFEYFNSLTDQMRCLQEDPKNCYAGQTSDSLYFYTSKVNYLICFINIFLHFNIYAMSKNVFFRGGIAKGTLYVNNPYQFYGDCVINSYLLEEEISNYPRVTIDKKTMEDIKDLIDSNYFEKDSKRNYLKPFSSAVMEDISEYLDIKNADFRKIDIEFIKKVRKRILDNKNKNEFNDKNYQKYFYLLENCDEMLNGIKE